jgi:hypothetical protein
MTTFNQFKFERVDGNSTLTLEVNVDGCQEIVDEFITSPTNPSAFPTYG